MTIRKFGPLLVLALAAALVGACTKGPADSGAPHKHEHHPPHGGTPVVLGDEAYHIELVLDAQAGVLQAYVFDGELENFIRCSAPSMEIDATAGGAAHTLVLAAVPNAATGETVGDTSLFQAQAEWLKGAREFDGVIPSVSVRGSTFTDVKFNFPRGNDTD